jgi:biotin synthase
MVNEDRKLLRALASGVHDEKTLGSALLLKNSAQKELFRLARERRSLCFPEEAEIRSVLEISNICAQKCNYCGINACSKADGYLLGCADVLAIAGRVHCRGRRVLLIQSGENDSQKFVDHVARCVSDIKARFPGMTMILCLGGLRHGQYRQLKAAGAERYILKFETSNPALYEKIKPGDSLRNRVAHIEDLLSLGFQVGSGNIIGLPGQGAADVARDLLFLSRFRLSMGSSSVFTPGENSKYRGHPPGDIGMTLNFMALLRIMQPRLLIPATSSLERRRGGMRLGLLAGANAVTIHDGTPPRAQRLFPIYSSHRRTPDEDFVRRAVRRAGLRPAPGCLDARVG